MNKSKMPDALYPLVLDAAACGYDNVIRLFNRRWVLDRETCGEALQAAADAGQVKVVRFLLVENLCDVNYDNASALFNAASKGHLPVVRLLLSKGATCSTNTAAWMANERNSRILALVLAKSSLESDDIEFILQNVGTAGNHQCIALILRWSPDHIIGNIVKRRTREWDNETLLNLARKELAWRKGTGKTMF
jgi:hypothetical protein